jgi:DNA polymerase-3 subunit alpha
LRRAKVVTYAELLKRGNRAEFVAGTITAKQERKSKKGNPFAFVSLSDPTGQFEVVVFSDVLNASRDLLEPGKAVVLTVEVEHNGDEAKLLAQSVRSVDNVVATTEAGMKVFIYDAKPLPALQSRLTEKGKGLVSLILLGEGGREIEIQLKGGYKVTPQIRGAIKSVPGVVDVQEI